MDQSRTAEDLPKPIRSDAFPAPLVQLRAGKAREGDKVMRAAHKRTGAKVARCENADCGNKFRPTRPWQKYCAPNCRKAAHFARKLARTKSLTAECPHCHHEFLVRMKATEAM